MGHGGDIYRNIVKKDFSVNLNPLGIRPEIYDAIRSAANRAQCYPDPYQEDVRKIIADSHGLNSDQVYAGSGASELIMVAVCAACPQKALLFEPCFSGYRHALIPAGCEITGHMLDLANNFSITENDLGALTPDIDLVFVCDPVNPAGSNVDEDIIKKLLDIANRNGTTVIVDESFFLMSQKALLVPDDRCRQLLDEYDNLYIIRSMTKILAVPGIRAGYVLSSPSNIKGMIKQLPEWNLSVTAEEVIKAGIGLMSGPDFVNKTVCLIEHERKLLLQAFRDMGFIVPDSDSAYILLKGPEDLYDELLKRGILIRDCSDYAGLEKGWFRVAVKIHEDNAVLIQAVREIINEH